MKPAYWIILLITAPLLIISCGERKNPAGKPPTPYKIVAEIPPVGVFKGLFLNGANSFIAADYAGLFKIDLSDPASPGYPFPCASGSVYRWVNSVQYFPATSHLYLIGSNGTNPGITLYDLLSDTTAQIKFITSSGPSQLYVQEVIHYVSDSLVVDSLLLHLIDNVGDEHGFYTQVYEPVGTAGFLRKTTLNYDFPNGLIYDFAVSDSGNTAYLAVDEYGMDIVDIPTETRLGRFDTEGFCRGIAVQGDYCYLADRYWGLQVLDVSIPAAPVRVANLRFEGARDCEKVRVCGDRALVMDLYDGVFAVDVSDPANPKELFNFDTVTPTDIAIDGDYIYVIDEDAGLVIASW